MSAFLTGSARGLGIDAEVAAISGFIGADAIIQFSPFTFKAEAHGGLRVEFLGKTFAGLRFEGQIAGPGPVTLNGRVTVETFIKNLHWNDTFVFGRQAALPGVAASRAVEVLHAEEFTPGNVRGLGVADPSVVLTTPDRQDKRYPARPLGR